MDPKIQAAKDRLTQQQVEKTIKEVRNNIARRERVAFGNGVLWCVIVTWFSMAMTYGLGHRPNPGIMIGSLMYGLWNRFGRD